MNTLGSVRRRLIAASRSRVSLSSAVGRPDRRAGRAAHRVRDGWAARARREPRLPGQPAAARAGGAGEFISNARYRAFLLSVSKSSRVGTRKSAASISVVVHIKHCLLPCSTSLRRQRRARLLTRSRASGFHSPRCVLPPGPQFNIQSLCVL